MWAKIWNMLIGMHVVKPLPKESYQLKFRKWDIAHASVKYWTFQGENSFEIWCKSHWKDIFIADFWCQCIILMQKSSAIARFLRKILFSRNTKIFQCSHETSLSEYYCIPITIMFTISFVFPWITEKILHRMIYFYDIIQKKLLCWQTSGFKLTKTSS